jgi:hypothetical protein
MMAECRVNIMRTVVSVEFCVLKGDGIQWRTQKFFSGGGGVQQIQLTGGRENRDLGAVAP